MKTITDFLDRYTDNYWFLPWSAAKLAACAVMGSIGGILDNSLVLQRHLV